MNSGDTAKRANRGHRATSNAAVSSAHKGAPMRATKLAEDFRVGDVITEADGATFDVTDVSRDGDLITLTIHRGGIFPVTQTVVAHHESKLYTA